VQRLLAAGELEERLTVVLRVAAHVHRAPAALIGFELFVPTDIK